MGGDEIARHDERLADVAAAVLRVVIEREAEDLVRVGRVDEAFRLVVETSHVGGELSELAGGAIGIDRSKKIPAIRESRGAVGMRERSESVLRRRHAEWRVHRRQRGVPEAGEKLLTPQSKELTFSRHFFARRSALLPL